MLEKQYSKLISRVLISVMVLLIICPIITDVVYADSLSVYVESEIKDNYGWTHAFGISYGGSHTNAVCCEPSEENVHMGYATAVIIDKGSKAAQIAYYAYTHPECSTQGSAWVYAVSSCMRQALTGDPYSSHYQSDLAGVIWNNATAVPDNIDVYKAVFSNAQDIMFCVPHPQGKLRISKTCVEDQSGYVNSNPNNYSLSSAEYGVYTDSACTDKMANLTTDSNGKSNTITLDVGTYYVKEIKASKGFYIDENVYTATVTENGYNVLNVYEKPGNSTVSLQKINRTDPGSSAGLEGAEFTFTYYDIDNGSLEDCSKTDSKYAWVFATKMIDGKSIINFDESYYVGGDELIKDSGGSAVIPIGTFIVKETLAPKGFACDEHTYLGHIYMDNNKVKYEIEGKETLTIAEKYQTVSIAVNKYDAETKANTAQGMATLSGAEFDVYYRDYMQSEDAYVGTIVTDNNGQGELTQDVNGNKLMPGYYRVKEVKSSEGYIVNRDEKTVNARIKEVNTANFKYTVDCSEEVHHTIVNKIAEDTGKQMPGAELQILDEDGNCVYEFTSGREAEDVIGLSEGTYVLHEKSAATGYCPAGDVEFEITSDVMTNTVEMTDMSTKAELSKIDTDGNCVKGAKLMLCSKKAYDESKLSGEERYNEACVYEYTSGDSCLLLEKELVAGMTYIMHEVKAPDGYIIADDIEFTVPDDGSTVEISMIDGIFKSFASELGTGEKSVELNKDATEYVIEDNVSYSGLETGKKYYVEGLLMSKTLNKAMVDDEGEKVTIRTDFIADDTSGNIKLQYSIEPDSVKDKAVIVAFNRLYTDTNNDSDSDSVDDIKLIGTDESLNNNNQSVSFYERTIIDTGDYNDPAIMALILLCSILGMVCIVVLIRKRM